MQIDGRQIGPLHRPYVIAELSCNHLGDFDRAMAIIEAAATAGADAIKFQIFDPADIAEARGGAAKIISDGIWCGLSLGDIYRRAHTPLEWMPYMSGRAEELGITWFASVFCKKGVKFALESGMPAIKISSFDAANFSLIAQAACLARPMIISCGMASDEQIGQAIHTVHRAQSNSTRRNNIALLHCVSDYPANLADTSLSRVNALQDTYGVPIGFSDHTIGRDAAVAAVARGACIIEKHLTLDRSDGGLDASFSMEPDELAALVDAVNDIHASCEGRERVAPLRDLMVIT